MIFTLAACFLKSPPSFNRNEQSTQTASGCCFLFLMITFLFRVRLVERGSPHSLSLMESGKVSFSSNYCFELPSSHRFSKGAGVQVHFSDWFYPRWEQILPGVRIIIANPETKGPMGESHLGEVCQLKLWFGSN